MLTLKDYKKIVGRQVMNEIKKKAEKFSGKHIVCISSSHQGGGVAEILNSLIFLFNELGIDFGWRIIHGSPNFFNITKKIHNGLQGSGAYLSKKEKETYLETNRRFSIFTHLDHDLVIVHDPQPLALIKFYKKSQPWIFRCHLDLFCPDKKVWNFLKKFIGQYDHFIVSSQEYKKKIEVKQSVIAPGIDPLSDKNKPLSKKEIAGYLKSVGINLNKPIITQISRFDQWKDPEGVIKMFELVRKKVDCQLVLLGNMAMDDPEGIKIYETIVRKYDRSKDIKILVNVPDNDLIVNALQRKAAVVIQKSLREGFGLTVSEALYKNTPVVASNIGGIPLQLLDGKHGFLHQPQDLKGFSQSVARILKDKKLRYKLGQNGKNYVKANFLITRLILDWLNLFEKYLR